MFQPVFFSCRAFLTTQGLSPKKFEVERGLAIQRAAPEYQNGVPNGQIWCQGGQENCGSIRIKVGSRSYESHIAFSDWELE